MLDTTKNHTIMYNKNIVGYNIIHNDEFILNPRIPNRQVVIILLLYRIY